MKEVCGYTGLDGNFYKTKVRCKKADLDYKVEYVNSRLYNFSNHLEDYIFRDFSFKSNLYKVWSREQETLLKKVAEMVLYHSNDFIEVIGKKKELEKELNQLQKQRNSWWLKTKWW